MSRPVLLLVLLCMMPCAFAAHPPGVVSVGPIDVTSLATTPDGKVYGGATGGIWRIDGGAPVKIHDGPLPLGLTAAPDGALVFWTTGYPSRVLRVFGGAEEQIGAPGDNGYGGIAVASDGAIWYAPGLGLRGLVRVAGGSVSRFFPSHNFGPLVAGNDGSVWAFGFQLYHVNADGSHTTLPVTPPRFAAPDRAGGVWYSNESPLPVSIRHIGANGEALPSLTIPGLNRLASLHTSPDGTLFIGSDKAVYRVQNGLIGMVLFDPPPAPPCQGFEAPKERPYAFRNLTDGAGGSVWVFQEAPRGFGFTGLNCPPSPPENYVVLNVPSSAFAIIESRVAVGVIPVLSPAALFVLAVAVAGIGLIVLKR